MLAAVGVLIVGQLAAAQPTDGPAAKEQVQPESAEAPQSSPAHAIVVDGRVEPTLLSSAELELRLPGRAITIAGGGAAPPEPYIWITAVARGGSQVQVTLIVSDGRLFRRAVQADSEQRARIVAGTLANMVDAIENHRLAPVETGVAVPEPEATAPPTDVAPPPADEAPAAREPAKAEPPGPAAPRWWIGVVGHAAATFGVGAPTAAAGPTGLGGGLGLHLVHATGAALAASVRGTGWQNAGVRLTRIRASITAGYLWRPGRFELLGAAGPTVEAPMLDRTLFVPSGGERRGVPLVGARVLGRPAYALVNRPHARLLLGLELEAGVALEARSPTGAVAVFRSAAPGEAPILRAGGFELAVGLSLEGRFSVRPSRDGV